MKKTLKISLDNNSFIVSCDKSKFSVSKDDLLIKGEDLYKTVFNDVILGELLEITYDEEGIIDSGDVRICKDIKSIIDGTVKKINESVKKEETEFKD